MSRISSILRSLGIAQTSAVSADKLNDIERSLSTRLPDSVRELYGYTDGCLLGPRGPQLLSIEQVRRYVDGIRRSGIPKRWGYLPLIENNDSNPYCLCCDSPIAGYVVHVSHDDAAQVKFRSLEDLLSAIEYGLKEPGWNLRKVVSQFSSADRRNEDIKAGKQLLDLAPGLGEVERGDAFRFGMWLLSDAYVADIARLLDDTDGYVREDAEVRLRAIGTAETQAALDEFRSRQIEFVSRCHRLLVDAGIDARVNRNDITLEPGPVHLNMEVFYTDRDNPNFADQFLERARYLLEKKAKR